jgi:hypothetical protein
MATRAAASQKITVVAFERRKLARRPLPQHLPRERIVYPSPTARLYCGVSYAGSARTSPRRWSSRTPAPEPVFDSLIKLVPLMDGVLPHSTLYVAAVLKCVNEYEQRQAS